MASDPFPSGYYADIVFSDLRKVYRLADKGYSRDQLYGLYCSGACYDDGDQQFIHECGELFL